MAPELTIGFVSFVVDCSMADTELNGIPVPLTPSRSRAACGPMAWHTSAKIKGLEMLMMVNSVSTSPMENS